MTILETLIKSSLPDYETKESTKYREKEERSVFVNPSDSTAAAAWNRTDDTPGHSPI